MPDTSPSKSPLRTLGTLLCRVVVPLWVLSGAVFKLMASSPKTLPKATFLEPAQNMNLDLFTMLWVLIGLEIFAVAVMVLSRRLARPMAIFMLGCFCLILVYEMRQGNVSSCGCFGAKSPPPWLMLTIDGLLLAAVIGLPQRGVYQLKSAAARYGLIAAITIAGFLTSFMVVNSARPAGDDLIERPDTSPIVDDDDGQTPVTPADTSSVSSENWQRDLPASRTWVSDQARLNQWIGKPWYEADLFGFMNKKPSGIDEGTKYIVFYSRSCDHCEAMFYEDLAMNEGLASMTTAVEIPLEKGMEATWDMPLNAAELVTLRDGGMMWLITPPMAFRIEDGIIRCAQEGDHKRCMDLE